MAKDRKGNFMIDISPSGIFCSDWGEDEQVHNLGGHDRRLPGAQALRDEGLQLVDGQPLRPLLHLLSKL